MIYLIYLLVLVNNPAILLNKSIKKGNGSEFLLDGQFDKVGLIASNSKIINNIAKGILDL